MAEAQQVFARYFSALGFLEDGKVGCSASIFETAMQNLKTARGLPEDTKVDNEALMAGYINSAFKEADDQMDLFFLIEDGCLP